MPDEKTTTRPRCLPVGAEPSDGGVSFRVWAPERKSVAVVLKEGGEHPLQPEDGGYFSGWVTEARAGSNYRFRLDAENPLYPDPATRFQPEGVHGPSEVVDPLAYRWGDASWPGVKLKGQVVYELHIGTFTPEGTYASAAEKLPHLRDVGITLIEMMPVSEFPGRFGWGYDGVDLFAPTRLYGSPDDLRRFVDAAHRLGIGVILDVVYNHFGPDGNYLRSFSPYYFSDQPGNEWGDAINFDGHQSGPVREFFITNAAYWIEEFHFDGLRLDATQAIHDESERHILADIVAACRRAACGRSVLVVGENEPQHTILVRPTEEGGYGLDALWNDDFHHSAIVAATGRREAYYFDFSGNPQELISSAKHGSLFQGQVYSWQQKRRGSAGLDLDPARWVTFLENHDQVANTAWGSRFAFRTTPGRARTITALLLLMPGTPMLFQGQEFWSRSPFLYFADHHGDLAKAVAKGRRGFLSQFASIANPAIQAQLPVPNDPATFEACRIDWSECERNGAALRLTRDLIRLRRETAAFAGQHPRSVDGAVLGPEAFLLRFFAAEGGDRLLIVNLGRDLQLQSIADPLAAPPAETVWRTAWSSEHPDYGGAGTGPVETQGGWLLAGHAAVVLAPVSHANATGEELPPAPVNPDVAKERERSRQRAARQS